MRLATPKESVVDQTDAPRRFPFKVQPEDSVVPCRSPQSRSAWLSAPRDGRPALLQGLPDGSIYSKGQSTQANVSHMVWLLIPSFNIRVLYDFLTEQLQTEVC